MDALGSYVETNPDRLTEVCIDGWFNLEALADKVIAAVKQAE